ncbi:hypothetical protein E2562_021520 [Oryza meyeriana var. granulata]|uniref:Wall-associated receptor kinase C-terminal domain-containing protein n=1 Tax=Oryza meyeriana var. granulata TaxID=110450 RepID=A0A6G1DZU6_9ORYZ|nr:hypothetical protein E2562_021520 [Oryza meyeriana var. granulata]
MCGRVNISYPFFLSTATSETYDDPSCGYTDLNITCSWWRGTETPIIQLGGDSYTILHILYDTRTVVLADTDALRGGSCPRVRHNFTFGQADKWLEYTGSRDNLTFFFGCHSPPNNPWPVGFAPDKYQINCKNFSNEPGSGVPFVSISGELDASVESELASHCTQVITVPVNGDLPMAREQAMLPGGGYGQVLQQGFELAWNPSKDDQCYRCEQYQGQCAYNQSKSFLGCLCSDGKVATNRYCTNSVASIVSASSKSGKFGFF